MKSTPMFDTVEVVVVSNDYHRDLRILRAKAEEFYEAGTIGRHGDGKYCLPRCKPCLLKLGGCKGGGFCSCKCHNFKIIRKEHRALQLLEEEKKALKRKRKS